MMAMQPTSRWITLLLLLVLCPVNAATIAPEQKITKWGKSSRALRRFFIGYQQRKATVPGNGGIRKLGATTPLTSDPRRLSTEKVLEFASSKQAEPSSFERALQRRGRQRKRIGKGSTSKGSQGGKRGKGGGKGSKGSDGSKGKGSNWSKGKGSNGSKGKGSNGSKGSKKGSSKSLSEFCRDLDFSSFYGIGSGFLSSSSKGKGPRPVFGFGQGKGAKGKGGKGRREKRGKKRRELEDRVDGHRSLQFGGELCAPNALEVARMNPNLSIFVDLIEATNLEEIFLCAGPFTVLAPSNAAFNENPDLLISLFNPRNVEAVQELLLYHIVPGLFLSDDLVEGPLETLLGEDVDVKLDPLKFNQAGATDVDIMACNGVIDIIDDILIPPDSPVLPEICEILDFRVDGQFPAPTRLRSIFDRRSLQETSVENGVQRRLQFEGERCDDNVFDVAQDNPDLTTFMQLIEAAGLQDLALCAGPFTVLAPTNSAFAKLDPGLLIQLQNPRNQELLQEILLYNMLPGYQPTPTFTTAGPTNSLLFGFDIDVSLNPLQFNDANVITPDIMACNGVIHTIDDVLIPDADFCDAFTFSDRRRLQDGVENCDPNVLDSARQNPNLSTVVSLIEAADLDDVFSCPGPFTALLPNNAAFANLDPAFLDFLLNPANQDDLQDLLLYHILPGATNATNFSQGPTDTLLLGQQVDVLLDPLRFDDAGVVTTDIMACNGLIDIIDTVLLPFDAPVPQPTQSPTDAPTPMDICDQFTFLQRMRRLQNGGQNCTPNVLQTAQGNPELSIFTTLLDLADLTPIFSCAGPFTMLVPTNSAFDDFDRDLLDSLLEPANVDDLEDFLLYHILPGATLTTDFEAGPTETLLAGKLVEVAVNPITFDGIGVLDSDITACNGFINIIDGVLNAFEAPTAPSTPAPTNAPVIGPPPPTQAPTPAPTAGSTLTPAPTPTAGPTLAPALVPTNSPTPALTNEPTAMPAPLMPTVTPIIRTRIQDYYIAFVAAGATREPTPEEYDEMLLRVTEWFETYFTDFYADDPDVEFLGTETELDLTLYGDNAGIPEDRYNIYMDFSFTDFIWSEDSIPPSTSELFDIMRMSINTDFILEQVRTFTGSPFETTNEVFFASSDTVPP